MTKSLAETNLISNKEAQFTQSDRHEAFLIATGWYIWHKNGSRVVFVQFPDNSKQHRRFCLEVLEMTVNQLQIVRTQCEKTGDCSQAVVVDSILGMIDEVSKHPGGVGYLVDDDALHKIENLGDGSIHRVRLQF